MDASHRPKKKKACHNICPFFLSIQTEIFPPRHSFTFVNIHKHYIMLRSRGSRGGAELSWTNTQSSSGRNIASNGTEASSSTNSRSSRHKRRKLSPQASLQWFRYSVWILSLVTALEFGYILALVLLSPQSIHSESSSSSINVVDSSLSEQLEILSKLQQGSPLDNYYSRPHIRDAVPLIVGGSDGSGTRAFVQVLEQLGVPMLVEDRGTMDVHAREIMNGAGWPALVSKVLNATRSATYDLEGLPRDLVDFASAEVAKFIKAVQGSGQVLVETGIGKTWATGVSWGFKAPVSILLLPFFRRHIPALKVLHVVRDGRDVALSENHSPVQKFYSDYFEDAMERHAAIMEEGNFGKEARMHIKSMQLWNDWNKQVYDYGVKYSDGNSLDVLVMRTEDLIHRPFESISLLADFVGSLKSSKKLCCLSQTIATDLGQSSGNHWGDLVEPGNSDPTTSLRGPRMVDPASFSQIRERFLQFSQKDPVKKLKQPDVVNTDTESQAHRRLTDLKPDGKGNILESGGHVASGEWNLPIGATSPHNLKGTDNEKVNQVTRMQQLLQERRALATPQKEPENPEQVIQRYGKWVKILHDDSVLSERLHKEGKEALSTFGYEPPRAFMDINTRLTLTCTASTECK